MYAHQPYISLKKNHHFQLFLEFEAGRCTKLQILVYSVWQIYLWTADIPKPFENGLFWKMFSKEIVFLKLNPDRFKCKTDLKFSTPLAN